MVATVNPYLYFNGNTEEAFGFYRGVFGGEFVGIVRYRDMPCGDAPLTDEDKGKIAHIALPLGKQHILMGTDSLAAFGGESAAGTNHSIVLGPDDAAEAKTLFDRLAEGGRVQMPLQRTDWAEAYGIVADRFGIQWMVNYEGDQAFSFKPDN